MMRWMIDSIGRAGGRYLSQPVPNYRPLTTSAPNTLLEALRPGDVLLVEGNTRVSGAIKYLTQSTWSHACLYIGNAREPVTPSINPPSLIETDMVEGARAVPLSTYAAFHTRICRPIALTVEDVARVVAYAISRLGHACDLKNMIDLMRFLLPMPSLPDRWRRRILALGSGDPTKAICSTLIAQAFQSVGYPILPEMRRRSSDPGAEDHNREILAIQHYSLYTPRDFDISPYFQVVKPTIEHGFAYRSTAGAAPAETPRRRQAHARAGWSSSAVAGSRAANCGPNRPLIAGSWRRKCAQPAGVDSLNRGNMSPKQPQHREPEELPLAHDAATWDEDTFESGWDDEQEQLVCEMARSADGRPGFASR